MSGIEHENQPPTIRSRGRRRRLHWTVVAGLWLIAGTWIAIDPLTGAHSDATGRWMSNMSLLLVAAACTTLIGYLIQVLAIEPHNDRDRRFELGYYAGRYDALHEGRPALGLVSDIGGSHGNSGGRTGT